MESPYPGRMVNLGMQEGPNYRKCFDIRLFLLKVSLTFIYIANKIFRKNYSFIFICEYALLDSVMIFRKYLLHNAQNVADNTFSLLFC